MSENKPTIIFLHGAFHGPECFTPLFQPLQDAGYPLVNDLALPGTGNSSTSSLEEDAQAVRSAVLKVLDEQERNCILVMHSYGAVPAAQGLQGLGRKDRGENKPAVVKMVYLTTNMPREGESHLEQLQGWVEDNGLPPLSFVDIKDDLVTFVGEPEYFYNGLPEEMQAELYSKLKTQSLHTLTTPLTYAAYKDIPGWYLVSKNDKVMPPEFQRYALSNAGDMMEVVEEIDAGHSSFLVQPEKVVDFILRAAKDCC